MEYQCCKLFSAFVHETLDIKLDLPLADKTFAQANLKIPSHVRYVEIEIHEVFLLCKINYLIKFRCSLAGVIYAYCFVTIQFFQMPGR